MERERKGDFLGKTVQVVPHVTDAIQQWILDVSQIPVDNSGLRPDVCIIELGGIVGDIESSPFVEALRQLQFASGPDNFYLIHVSLIPVVGTSKEQKTKPTQASVRELRSLGLIPDAICCRCTDSIQPSTKSKISMFCQVSTSNVIDVHDSKSMYLVPWRLHEEHLLQSIQKKLKLTCPDPEMPVLGRWKRLGDVELSIDACSSIPPIRIAIVGKYIQLHDAYSSIQKSLEHASIAWQRKVDIVWIDSVNLEHGENAKKNANSPSTESSFQIAEGLLQSAHGIIVPGGFGERGTEGKIYACNYARMNNIPFLGICLGFQLAVVEFCRNVLGFTGANSSELAPDTPYPVIIPMPEISTTHMGGTMRLGSRATNLLGESMIKHLYGDVNQIHERHRHRYEVNPEFVPKIEAAGMKFVGRDEKNERMECMQLDGHPYYVGVQYHPEFKSRPLEPAPLFIGFIQNALQRVQ